ncbi:MAG: NAD(+) diphosphatase [Kiritimatiellae bacterium]|jgi:NAD+ diphosphatase|nr:NAD(+) diphosphatase [Kiritimatiellia bacterium]NLD90143.1 NAD(+) diphosphatase [Lentisphaerota bacterium]HOU21783.1 NAD(+) diphosphatase [Kiritimatiellia bacterium]HQQ61447.1 NAD(+) diphosphatase [Kiritimatiellia bacterium]
MVPATATFIFCDGHLLVRAGELEPAGAATLAELRRTRAVLDEFTVRPRGDLAVAVSGAAETPPPGCEWVRLRALIGAEAPRAGPACRALGMVNWRATHRFCGRCGGPLAEHPADAAGTCAACGQVEYPSLAPAVIMRVEKAGQILLARHVQRIPDLWTCLAGYVELGESLEDCVRREVREEAGIEVADIRYVASQPWPYPNQLMVGFVAQWKSGELQLQPEELAEARWFDPADLPTIPPKGSMAWRLIRGAF